MAERDVQRAIMDLLAAKHVLAFRMQVGAMRSEYKGKSRFMRFGTPGMADILAFPKVPHRAGNVTFVTEPIVWIECKREDGGKQSAAQKSFQEMVEREGHRYILASSVDDVLPYL